MDKGYMVKRKFTTYPIYDIPGIKQKMLNWLKPFNIFCFLDNHHYQADKPAFEFMVAAGMLHSIELMAGNAFDQLEIFRHEHDDWIFGHLSYDLKNEVENLSSNSYDGIGFPDLFFYVPEVILIIYENELKIGVCELDADMVYATLISSREDFIPSVTATPGNQFLKSRFSQNEYIQTVEKLKAHILRGDCYEINFCQEFYMEDKIIDPIQTYQKLASVSPNPFASLYRVNDKYCLCESPERYLKKKDTKLCSQPIKGTVARFLDGDLNEDNKNTLHNSKERSENVMIVDLVRNDLAKVCEEGSVHVDELFGIYTFPHLYQMISTISGTVKSSTLNGQIFKATFPMGSMTGVPKPNVMRLIEFYERTRRGLFSGSIGYITPENDFDFNVVIRSILYNSVSNYISVPVGSAITFYSDPKKEYEECQLKISAIKGILE